MGHEGHCEPGEQGQLESCSLQRPCPIQMVPIEIIQQILELLLYSGEHQGSSISFENARQINVIWRNSSLRQLYLLTALRDAGYSVYMSKTHSAHELLLSERLSHEYILLGRMNGNLPFRSSIAKNFDAELSVSTKSIKSALPLCSFFSRSRQYYCQLSGPYLRAFQFEDCEIKEAFFQKIWTIVEGFATPTQAYLDDSTKSGPILAYLEYDRVVITDITADDDVQLITLPSLKEPTAIALDAERKTIYLSYAADGSVSVMRYEGRLWERKPDIIYNLGPVNNIRFIPGRKTVRTVNGSMLDTAILLASTDHNSICPPSWKNPRPNFHNAVPFDDGKFLIYTSPDGSLCIGCDAPPSNNDSPQITPHFTLTPPEPLDGRKCLPHAYEAAKSTKFGARVAVAFGCNVVLYTIAPDVLSGITAYERARWESPPSWIYGVSTGAEMDEMQAVAATRALGLSIRGIVVGRMEGIWALRVEADVGFISVWAFSTDGSARWFYYESSWD